MTRFIHCLCVTPSTPVPIQMHSLNGAAIAGLLMCSAAQGDIAASVNSQGLAIAFSSVNISQGWRFSVDVPIEVTALGLLDSDNDGFQASHPIALWNGAGAMIASAALSAGTFNPLIDRFRYVPLESDSGVILTPGQNYTIGYYLSATDTSDAYVIWNGVHTMNPHIHQDGTSFYTLSNSLTMPATSTPGQCFGPNFQFLVVPEPACTALAVIAVIGMIPSRRRR